MKLAWNLFAFFLNVSVAAFLFTLSYDLLKFAKLTEQDMSAVLAISGMLLFFFGVLLFIGAFARLLNVFVIVGRWMLKIHE